MNRPVVLGILVIVLAAGGLLAWLILPVAPGEERPAPAAIQASFSLIDQDGRPVTEQTYRGRWLVVLFGYTWCPDSCPASLSNLSTALTELGPVAGRVQPLLISVDPARDRPAILAAYTKAFDERILGLTGTETQISAALKNFQAVAVKVPQEDTYLLDHTGAFYVVAPDGRYVLQLPGEASPEFLTDALASLIAPSS